MRGLRRARAPREQLAILGAAGAWPAYVLFIVTVDGQDAGLLTEKVSLLPGTRISLTLEAKAGRAYRVERKSVRSDPWAAWIVDTETNEVVSGRRP